MATKIFKTLDEQIEILKEKGLIIDDIEDTKNIILRENYFFLMGYRHLFLKDGTKTFIEGTKFREIYALFSFDRQLRNIIFKNILIIENNIKSIFSYVLSGKYGYREEDYLKPSNYNCSPERKRQVQDLIRKMKRQIRVNGMQHEATKHYLNNYGYIPLWVVVKVLSFGITAELYTILKEVDKKEIANYFHTTTENLDMFLPILSNYRNLCAHEDITYDHRTQKMIPDNEYLASLSIPKVNDEFIYGKGDLFAVVIIFKYLLSNEDFRLFVHELEYEIDILEGKLKTINLNTVLDKMGFPINYMDIINETE